MKSKTLKSFEPLSKLEQGIDTRNRIYNAIKEKEKTISRLTVETGNANPTVRTYIKELEAQGLVKCTNTVRKRGTDLKYIAINEDKYYDYIEYLRKKVFTAPIDDPAKELKKAIEEGRIKGVHITLHEATHSVGNKQKMNAWTGYEGMAGL